MKNEFCVLVRQTRSGTFCPETNEYFILTLNHIFWAMLIIRESLSNNRIWVNSSSLLINQDVYLSHTHPLLNSRTRIEHNHMDRTQFVYHDLLHAVP